MSRPIQSIPPGLLSLFQLKNEGKNPSEFVETVQPTIDLLRWYLEPQAENLSSGTQQVNTAGVFTTFTPLAVPVGEFWIVTGASMSIACGVGETITAKMGYTPGVGAGTEGLTQYESLIASQTGLFTMSKDFAPLYCPGGATFGVHALAVVGSPDVVMVLRFVRLKP